MDLTNGHVPEIGLYYITQLIDYQYTKNTSMVCMKIQVSL